MYISLQRILSNKYIRYIIVAILGLLAVVSVIQGVRNAAALSQDFQWDATKALMSGIDPYEASLNPDMKYNNAGLDEFYRLFTDAGVKQKMEANQFPSLLILLVPFTWMNPLTARYAWIVANLLFTAGIIFLLKKTILKRADNFEFAVIVLLMLAGTPYRNQLGVGQHTLFSFFFFLAAVYYDECRPKGNSIAVTLCMFISYFKYTLTAPLTLYLLYRRRFKEFAVSVVMHVILTILAAVKLGKSIVYMILAPLKVSSMLSAEGGLDLGALFSGNSLYLVIAGLVVVILIYIAYKLPEGKGYLLLPILTLWSLILVYHRTYDFFVLAAVAYFYINDDDNKKLRQMTIVPYYLVTILVYFGLRVFNENVPSRIVVGIIYYAFTVYLTVLTLKESRKLDG